MNKQRIVHGQRQDPWLCADNLLLFHDETFRHKVTPLCSLFIRSTTTHDTSFWVVPYISLIFYTHTSPFSNEEVSSWGFFHCTFVSGPLLPHPLSMGPSRKGSVSLTVHYTPLEPCKSLTTLPSKPTYSLLPSCTFHRVPVLCPMEYLVMFLKLRMTRSTLR